VPPGVAPGQLVITATAYAGSASASDTLTIFIADSAQTQLVGRR